MKDTRFMCFLFFVLSFFAVTGLAPATEMKEGRDFWDSFDENTTDFSTASKLLKKICDYEFRTFDIVEDEPPSKIPFDDLTASQGSVSEHWYAGGQSRIVVSKDSCIFYEKVICPKLHKFLKSIASDVQKKTYTFVRDSRYLRFNSDEFKNDVAQLEKPAVIIIQSKTYKKIVDAKSEDQVDLNVTIYVLPNAYGEAIPDAYRPDSHNVYTFVKYSTPDNEDRSYDPEYVNITFPTHSYYPDMGQDDKIVFSPYPDYGVEFKPADTALYRGDADLESVVVTWDNKGNADLEEAKETKEREDNDPELRRQRTYNELPDFIKIILPYMNIYFILIIIIMVFVLVLLILGILHICPFGNSGIMFLISILYAGGVCIGMSYLLIKNPELFLNIWLVGGLFFLPFGTSYFQETPEERLENAIEDKINSITSPGVGCLIMILRPLLKLLIFCLIGGIGIHVVFWCRATMCIFGFISGLIAGFIGN